MKDLSLYIHIPFCKTICLYCNFLTFAHKNKWIPDYIDKLVWEIKEKSNFYKNHKIKSIYFGGGTPGLIDTIHIKKVIGIINAQYQKEKKIEISIECNPENITPEKLKTYWEIGINRISLGIQSLDKKTLFRVARPHDAKTIFKALDIIKASDFKNFGADFIIGLPYQTLQTFKEEVNKILTYSPPHLSFYFLSYDTNRIDIFKKDCPNEENEIKMYEYLIKKLKQVGYIHYEVSNYAKSGFECEHNLRYWHQKEYVGFGLGAHSYVNRKVFVNITNFDEYLKNPLQIEEEIIIDSELHRQEYILLHLRTAKGMNKKDYMKKFKDISKLMQKAESYLKSGHLINTEKNLHASEKGFLILDKMTRDLVDF